MFSTPGAKCKSTRHRRTFTFARRHEKLLLSQYPWPPPLLSPSRKTVQLRACPHLSDVRVSAVLVHGYHTDLQEVRAQNRALRSTGSIRVHRRRSAAPWREERYSHPPNGLVELLDLLRPWWKRPAHRQWACRAGKRCITDPQPGRAKVYRTALFCKLSSIPDGYPAQARFGHWNRATPGGWQRSETTVVPLHPEPRFYSRYQLIIPGRPQLTVTSTRSWKLLPARIESFFGV